MSGEASRAEGGPELARTDQPKEVNDLRAERDEARTLLDAIRDHLIPLEKSLSHEQVLLCPIDLTRWDKQPERSEWVARLKTAEGKRQYDEQLAARIEQHEAWRKTRG